jgi:hypothetical protein
MAVRPARPEPVCSRVVGDRIVVLNDWGAAAGNWLVVVGDRMVVVDGRTVMAEERGVVMATAS